MTSTLRAALAAALLALPVAPAAAQGVFVSPAQVAKEQAAGARIVFLDVGRSEAQRREGRLPGAVDVALADVAVTRDGIPNELPPAAQLVAFFERIGVGDGVPVVIYGDPLAAARVWMTLDVLGFEGARLLDGGFARWKAEGRPLGEANASPAPASLTPHWRADRLTDAEWIRAHLADREVALVDARSPGEFAGTQQTPQVPRPGHIPGAHNVFWKRLLQSDSVPALRDRAELEQLVPSGTRDVVAYCRTGHMASMLYAVARELGRPVKLYDPSFVEWSGRGDLPVEQGPGR